MLDRLTGKSVHLYIHIFSCIGLAGGLPASKIPLSLATMLLFLNILLEAKFKDYWQNLKTNKLAWGLWVFIACEWISLCWTKDFGYALHDFNAKLPLYSIPLVLVAKPITERKHLYLIGCFFSGKCLCDFIYQCGQLPALVGQQNLRRYPRAFRFSVHTFALH